MENSTPTHDLADNERRLLEQRTNHRRLLAMLPDKFHDNLKVWPERPQTRHDQLAGDMEPFLRDAADEALEDPDLSSWFEQHSEHHRREVVRRLSNRVAVPMSTDQIPDKLGAQSPVPTFRDLPETGRESLGLFVEAAVLADVLTGEIEPNQTS